MKYFWLGCGILAVLLAGGILCNFMVKQTAEVCTQPLYAALEQLEQENFPAAAALGQRAAAAWKKRTPFLSSILSHQELDEIAQSFEELDAYGAAGDETEFRCRCQLLLLRLKHISEMDLPYFYNFLCVLRPAERAPQVFQHSET